ncbi:MAG: cobalamin-binding protein [Pseudomonadales bacterium]
MIKKLRAQLAASLAFLFASSAGVVLANPIEVTDFLGRNLQLQAPAERVIALAPHIVENVYSAGAGDKLVGVVSYSNFPKEAQSIPIVGGYKSYSVETIIALKPDLILMWASGNGDKALQQLSALGFTVYVDELSSLDDIAKFVQHIGQMTGTEDTANESVNEYVQELTSLRDEHSQSAAVSVFYQVWNEPLQTINGKHIINDVIGLCGGKNIFSDAAVLAPKISLESVIVADPQVIVASGMDEARPEWLDDWRKWPQLQAVKREHVYFIPPDLLQRHTFRLLQGAQQLCSQLTEVREPLH